MPATATLRVAASMRAKAAITSVPASPPRFRQDYRAMDPMEQGRLRAAPPAALSDGLPLKA